MAARDELIAEAEELRKELGIKPIAVESLNDTALEGLVNGLRKKAAGAASEAKPAAAPGAAAKASAGEAKAATDAKAAAAAGAASDAKAAASDAKAPAPTSPRYEVAKGRGITSNRGVLGPGERVTPEMLGGGQTSLDELVAKNHVVKL